MVLSTNLRGESLFMKQSDGLNISLKRKSLLWEKIVNIWNKKRSKT